MTTHTTDPRETVTTPAEVPEVDLAEQAAFFARMDAKLDDSDLSCEPAWKARTIGHLVLNPQAYRAVMTTCLCTMLLAGAWIGFSWKHANRPLDSLQLPPGYFLISTPDGQVAVVMDRSQLAPGDDNLRAAALDELHRLMAAPRDSYPADALAVSASSSP